MTVMSAKLTFRIPHSASLKDKRQVSRSIIDKARQKFNASVSEVCTQDVIQTLTIGIAVVSGDAGHAKQSLDAVIRYMESQADAELTEVQYERL